MHVINLFIIAYISVGLVLSIMRILHILIPVGYVNLMVFLFSISLGYIYTMQEPSHLRKIVLVSIWFRMVLNLRIARVYKDSLTLDIPYQISIFDCYHKFNTHG